MLPNQQFNILVGTIPLRNQSVLLLQRSQRERFMPGVWGLPCGKIEFGEDLEKAALRELKEESGLVGEVVQQVGCTQFFSEKDGVSLHNLQVNYLINAGAGEVTLDGSSQDYAWVELNALPTHELDEFTISTIGQIETIIADR